METNQARPAIAVTRWQEGWQRPSGAAPAANPIALAERRLGWADRRQSVLAQNIANADTPGYRPRDLLPFAQHLAEGRAGQGLARTSPQHLGPTRPQEAASRADRQAAEAAPDGNAVSLDREAMRVAETDTAHALALAIHRSFAGMFRLTLGRN
jgi:flagellar basal-body rod protein FlgB